jgi:hypothetical protein
LRIYLQVYIEHWRRLEPIRRRFAEPRLPIVEPLQNPILRVSAGVVLYLLLPLTMLAFTWKAAIIPAWGSGLLAATVGAATSHVMLLLRCSWRVKVLSVVGATAFAAAAVYSLEPLSRPANLFQADLSGRWLRQANLQCAYLRDARLKGADLYQAELMGANLFRADLQDALLAQSNLAESNLWIANLAHANLVEANLELAELYSATLADANLRGAKLEGANLEGANLEGANLAGASLVNAAITQAQLDQACGDKTTKLPEDLSIRPCPSSPQTP